MKKVDLGKLEKVLPSFLENARWWIGGVEEYEIVDILEADKGFLLFLKTRDHLFQLPMVRVEKPRKELIASNRYVKINGEYYVEAEYTPYYFELMENLGIDHEDYTGFTGKIVEAKPLALGTTNVVGLHVLGDGSKLVVKGYRLLAKVNLEPLMYRELYRRGFKHIPRLHRIYYYELDVKYYLSLVTKYVEGTRDAGYPFYKALHDYLVKKRKGEKIRIQQACLSNLAWRLARIIADMHIRLNPSSSKEFLGLEEITSQDIRAWERRIDARVKFINNTLDKLIGESKGRVKVEYEYWLKKFNEAHKTITEVKNVLAELFTGTYKGRIHQDLHLQQMIYIPSDNNFIITDFEGEPGRTDEERLMKEPLIRDLATMVQSFHYLAFFTYKDVMGGSEKEKNPVIGFSRIGKKIAKQKNPITMEWVLRHTIDLAYVYAHVTSKEIIGRDLFNYKYPLKKMYHVYLAPWVIERALYETVYELTYGGSRSGWFVIPLTAIINPLLPVLKLS